MKWMALVFGLALALAAWALPGIAGEAAVPETADGLKAQMTQVLAAVKADDKEKVEQLTQGLVLPDPEAWFKEVFGDELGEKVAADYTRRVKDLPTGVAKTIARYIEQGYTEVNARKAQKDDDLKDVPGRVRAAFAAMKKPVPLYAAGFCKPGEKWGNAIYSFVYVKDAFRVIGKLRPIPLPEKKAREGEAPAEP